MKNINIKILVLVCGALVVTNVHGAYYNPNNEYDSYYDNQRYSNDDYTPRNYASKKTRSPIVPNDVRFFVGLETTLMSYIHVKENQRLRTDYFTQDINDESSDTSINYNPFANAIFSFGLESDNGYRFALKIMHDSAESKSTGDDSQTETTITGFMGSLDIPFVKLETTSPFLRFGVGYIIEESDDNGLNFDLNGFMFDIGLGVTHNFSKNIFGVLVGHYNFVPKAKMSTSPEDGGYRVDGHMTENGFLLNLGLGYRF